MPIPPPQISAAGRREQFSKKDAPAMALLLASCEMPLEMRPVRCRPNAKSKVAANISQGMSRKKRSARESFIARKKHRPSRQLHLSLARELITRREIFSVVPVRAAAGRRAHPQR